MARWDISVRGFVVVGGDDEVEAENEFNAVAIDVIDKALVAAGIVGQFSIEAIQRVPDEFDDDAVEE